MARLDNVWLTTLVERCTNNSVTSKIFGYCSSDEKRDKYINRFFSVHLFFEDS